MNHHHELDLFAVLCLPPTASPHDIQRNYKYLSRVFHPDKTIGEPHGAESFVKIQQAYEVLMDPVYRFAYDVGGWKAVVLLKKRVRQVQVATEDEEADGMTQLYRTVEKALYISEEKAETVVLDALSVFEMQEDQRLTQRVAWSIHGTLPHSHSRTHWLEPNSPATFHYHIQSLIAARWSGSLNVQQAAMNSTTTTLQLEHRPNTKNTVNLGWTLGTKIPSIRASRVLSSNTLVVLGQASGTWQFATVRTLQNSIQASWRCSWQPSRALQAILRLAKDEWALRFGLGTVYAFKASFQVDVWKASLSWNLSHWRLKVKKAWGDRVTTALRYIDGMTSLSLQLNWSDSCSIKIPIVLWGGTVPRVLVMFGTSLIVEELLDTWQNIDKAALHNTSDKLNAVPMERMIDRMLAKRKTTSLEITEAILWHGPVSQNVSKLLQFFVKDDQLDIDWDQFDAWRGDDTVESIENLWLWLRHELGRQRRKELRIKYEFKGKQSRAVFFEGSRIFLHP